MALANETEPFADRVDLTPALARVLLENNPNNRSVNQSAVQEWAEALLRGEWELNGETIIVSLDGKLNDGQHRCEAVITANVTMPVFMAFGFSRESRSTIDLGKKRTAQHIFGMQGLENGQGLAAAVKILLNMKGDAKTLDSHHSVKTLLQKEKDFPGLSASVAPGRRVGQKFKVSGALMTALHYRMRQIDPALADLFFEKLETGDGLGKKSPISVLRDRLINNLGSKAKLPKIDIAAFTIKTWNLCRDGKKSAGMVRWTNVEKFPVIR